MRPQGLGAQRAPTLVVCPLSVMANWEEQIREHLKGLEALETDSGDLIKVEEGAGTSKGKGKAKKGKGLRVAIYHGKERGALKLQALQVCACLLSSYASIWIWIGFSLTHVHIKHPPHSPHTK